MKIALVYGGLFVAGAILAAFVSLCIVLPDSSIPCGDECGGRALVTALWSAVAGAIAFPVVGYTILRSRRQNKGNN